MSSKLRLQSGVVPSSGRFVTRWCGGGGGQPRNFISWVYIFSKIVSFECWGGGGVQPPPPQPPRQFEPWYQVHTLHCLAGWQHWFVATRTQELDGSTFLCHCSDASTQVFKKSCCLFTQSLRSLDSYWRETVSLADDFICMKDYS